MTDESSKESRRSANERRAAAQAMRQKQLAKERQRRNLMAGGGVLVVLVILGTLVGIAVSNGNKNTSGPAVSATTSLASTVTSIPESEYNTVGNAGGTTGGYVAASALSKINTAALTKDGKPRVLYVGAEWCPYCAAQRWVLATAMSRFGTFSHLGQTSSSSTDVYPSTPTLSFYGSTFTSPYVVFDPYEIEDNQRNTLAKLSAADNALFSNPNLGASGFPFIDIAGKYKAGVMFNPGVLRSDPSNQYSNALTYAQIEAGLKDPNSAIAKSILGAANVFTAAVCKETNNKPANVCTSPGVVAAAADVS